ncbi:MAG: site-2 protease family protein [Verrucomicrobia bacterium]|nr:site-2 protease family protein [Verrucomicrobiota bacterium]
MFWVFLIFFTRIYDGLSIEGLLCGGVFFLSLLAHEYGHALTAAFFGAKPSVVLEAFGGKAIYDGRGITPKQSFLITLNGPLVTGLLIALSYGLLKANIFAAHPYLQYALYLTFHLNIFWLIFNLIPLAPLDGGYLLRYLLEKKFGSAGHKAAIFLGFLCALAALPYLYERGAFMFMLFLVVYGLRNFQALRSPEEEMATTKSPFSCYMEGVKAFNAGDFAKAKSLLKPVLFCKDLEIRHWAIEALAKVYLETKEDQKAYDLLLKADPNLLKEGKCFLCKLAFARKNYDLVAKYAKEIYDLDPSYEIALLNAQAFAAMRQNPLAEVWYNTASQFGV